MGSCATAILLLKLNLQESLTPQEDHILGKCIAEGRRSFLSGAALGGGIGMIAVENMRSLSLVKQFWYRASVVTVPFCIFGLYALERTERSCAKQILALDGTRLQKELVTIITKEFRDSTSLMRLVSGRFYEEKVIGDSSADSIVIRWRYRNVFNDSALYDDKPQHPGSQAEYGDSTHGHGSQVDSHVASVNGATVKKASVKPKQLPIGNSSNEMDDPLDQIFGHTTHVEEIQLPGGTGAPTKESGRNNKRSHRRRRHRRHEVSADWDHVQPQRI